MGTTEPSRSGSSTSLKECLEFALPIGFECKIRYVRTPSKACDSLFSALPGCEPEKTRLASHFLIVSVNPSALPQAKDKHDSQDVISFAVEVLVFISKYLTTIFVSKVDSTSYIPRSKPSPIKTTVTTFLHWLADRELHKRPKRKIVLSLFARAQAQYLFPGSSDDKNKHVLDDRQLIKWWARVLDPIFPRASEQSTDADYQGYLTVPGYNGNELRSFMPPSAPSHSSNPHWKPGNPLIELGAARGVPEHAPPRCLLPRFPDDPKARFMDDLDEEVGMTQDSQSTLSPSKRKSGRWNSIRDLDRFWEAMEFRQECSSGRVVGFLWLVISPRIDDDQAEAPSQYSLIGSQESQTSVSSPPTPRKRKDLKDGETKRRKVLSGPIIARQPRLKSSRSKPFNSVTSQPIDPESDESGVTVTKDGYDKAMQTLLNLDFSNLDIAVRSTTKWISELTGTCGLRGDFKMDISGSAKVETQSSAQAGDGPPVVNDLGGMIRKKRKAVENPQAEVAATTGVPEQATPTAAPAVNVLGGGLVRKKPKPATSS